HQPNGIAVLGMKLIDQTPLRVGRVLGNLFDKGDVIQSMNLFDLVLAIGEFKLIQSHASLSLQRTQQVNAAREDDDNPVWQEYHVDSLDGYRAAVKPAERWSRQ